VTLRQVRIILWGLVAAAAVAATVVFFVMPPRNPVGAGLGGGDYALVDQKGQPADETILVGQPSLLFFGYTHCPDVCPTTLAEMAAWFDALGDEAKTLRGVYVTVDPERDTPQMLDQYVSWVSDRVVALTGTQAEIDKVVKAWGVTAEKVPGSNGGYTMNHTASVFLVNAQGGFEGTIAYGEPMDTALAKIRRLVAEG
jgi:protein SCO1/2